MADAACSIDVEKYREMEALVARYQEEDTDLHRAISSLQADLHTQAQRAEEDGYVKGLADGRADSERLDWLKDFGVELADDVTEPEAVILRYLTAESHVREAKGDTLRDAIDAAMKGGGET